MKLLSFTSISFKLISFAMALLAVVGIVVQPVAPAYAAVSDGLVRSAKPGKAQPMLASQSLDEFILGAQIRSDVREKLARHAAHGEVAILSLAQMNDLARTYPALYAKLMRAYRAASTPNLTTDEKEIVDRLTAGNVAAFKAGIAVGCGAVASANSVATLLLPQNCSSSNMTGAWVIVGLLLTVIIGLPLFCAIMGSAAPAFCRDVTGP